MNKKILITGGAGFFGSKLSEILLSDNNFVTVYDNLYFGQDGVVPLESNKNYKFIKGDVTNYDDLKPYIFDNDIVIHLAALVGEPVCKEHKDQIYKINTDPAKFISDICNENNKKLVFLSTCSNYGKTDLIVNEDSELNPLGLYSDSKIKAEEYILEKNKSALVLRCSTLFGVSHRMRVDLTINQFVYEILTNGSVSVYGESAWRPYLHVEDASNLILSAININMSGVCNIGDESLNYTKKQIVDILSKKFLFNIEYVNWDDPRDYKVDFSKLKSLIDYKIKFTLEDGIDELSRYLKTDEFKNKTSIKNQ
jgi:nucleoside-diphosphate-sugar epimerase